MYKIYVNQKPLIIISAQEKDIFLSKPEYLLVRYPGKAKFLLNYIDMLEKDSRVNKVALYDENERKIYKDLKTIASPVKAAGGIVLNEYGELLVIFRKGYWDLPKGHINKNEKKRHAAIREVMEETGIKHITIGQKAGKTYHIYKQGKKRHLKISHWYFMKAPKQPLSPQVEEDITDARWVPVDIFLKNYDMFANIKDLLRNIYGS